MTQTHEPAPPFDLVAHLARQAAWSEKTFGPGPRVEMVVDHIRKELLEIEADPADLEEWVDLIILALDGAWRAGANPQQIIDGIVAKQTKNEGRAWPDWRTSDPNKAIEHDRSNDLASTSKTHSCAAPAGYSMVPVTPTNAMLSAIMAYPYEYLGNADKESAPHRYAAPLVAAGGSTTKDDPTGATENLPCPFCGGTNINDGEVLSEKICGKTFTQSACDGCGALGPEAPLDKGEVDYGDAKAIAAWNIRSVGPRKMGEVKPADLRDHHLRVDLNLLVSHGGTGAKCAFDMVIVTPDGKELGDAHIEFDGKVTGSTFSRSAPFQLRCES